MDVDTFTEQLNALKAQFEVATKSLEDTKAELAAVKSKSSEPKVIYAQREKKLKKFQGDESAADWVQDAQSGIALRKEWSEEEKLDYVLSHLEGLARDELKYRSKLECNTVQKVFDILLEVFSDVTSVSEVLGQFHCRRQREGESLMAFAQALMKLMDQAIKLNKGSLGDKDKQLRDHFSEFVRDSRIKMALKRLIRSSPDTSFMDIRGEAIAIENDVKTPVRQATNREIDVAVAAASTPEGESAKLYRLVKDQGDLIANMAKELKELKMSRMSHQKATFTCFRCQEPGHLKRNCPLNKQPKEGLPSQ